VSRLWTAALVSALSLSCGTTGDSVRPAPPRPEAGDLKGSDAIRISYFRFDDLESPEGPKRGGASTWVVYSRSWARRFGENIDEPYVKAFPRARVGPQGVRLGVVLATGVYPDAELRKYVDEIIRRGFLKLPGIPMREITRERTLAMYQNMSRGRFFRVMSVATDRGSHTVLLEPLVPNPPIEPVPAVARRFVEVETFLASVVSRLAIATDKGVLPD
jgi:hypothetical protein